MYSILEITESSDPSSAELVTLADVKTDLAISGTSEDAALSARIVRASAAIADYCDRRFAYASARQTFVFEPCETRWLGRPLFLALYPVALIASVAIDETVLETSEYEADLTAGAVYRIGGNRSGFDWAGHTTWFGGRVVIEYSGGYQLPDEAPGALQQACLELVRTYRGDSAQAGTRDAGLQSIEHGDTRVMFNRTNTTTVAGISMPASVINLLGQFRRFSFA